EAGAGGAGPCFAGPEGPACFGHSGSVTRIDGSGQRRVLTGLPSYGEEGQGSMYVTEGLGLDLDFSKTIPALSSMGKLLNKQGAKLKVVADLAAFEDANNPAGDEENV